MNFLRNLLFLLLFESIFVFVWFICYSIKHPWFWLITILQLIVVYVLAEIVHTMFKKPKLPHVSSLAFQRIMSRYKI